MKYLMQISGEIPHLKIEAINIPLYGRNLIITGKNGSGKTSFLTLLEEKILLHLDKKGHLTDSQISHIKHYESQKEQYPKGSAEYSQAEHQLNYLYEQREKIKGGLQLSFDNELQLLASYDELKAIFVPFKAMRMSKISNTTQTSSIEYEKKSAIQTIKNKSIIRSLS